MGSTPYKMERVAERRRELLQQLETRLSDWRADPPREYKKTASAIGLIIDESLAGDGCDDVVEYLVHTEALNDVSKDLEHVCTEAADKALEIVARGAKRIREQEEATAAPPAKKARKEEEVSTNPFPVVTDAEYSHAATGYMKYKIAAFAISHGIDPMAMFTPNITAKMNKLIEDFAKLDEDPLLGAVEKERKEDKDAMEVEHVIVSDGAQSDFVRMADLFATSAEPAASKDPDFVAATPDDELPLADAKEEEEEEGGEKSNK